MNFFITLGNFFKEKVTFFQKHDLSRVFGNEKMTKNDQKHLF